MKLKFKPKSIPTEKSAPEVIIKEVPGKTEVVTLEKIVEVPGPVQYVDKEVIKYVDREVFIDRPVKEIVYVDKPQIIEREVIKEIPAEPIYVDREVIKEVRVEVPSAPEQVFIDRIRIVEKVRVPPALVAALVLEALIIIYLAI